jgi:hypothetical protein
MKLKAQNAFSVLINSRATALGRYCLKRLPSTCMVVIVENREIILNKKGKLQLLQVSSMHLINHQSSSTQIMSKIPPQSAFLRPAQINLSNQFPIFGK